MLLLSPSQVRIVIRFQPKIHWCPEIYERLGRDYGRTFLQKEASIDIAAVIAEHSLSDLTSPSKEAFQMAVIQDLKGRLMDACHFHHIKMDETDFEVQFLMPEF